jgi:hypothetical protein
MPSNRGVVYLKPGSVEVQKIDFPTFRIDRNDMAMGSASDWPQTD